MFSLQLNLASISISQRTPSSPTRRRGRQPDPFAEADDDLGDFLGIGSDNPLERPGPIGGGSRPYRVVRSGEQLYAAYAGGHHGPFKDMEDLIRTMDEIVYQDDEIDSVMNDPDEIDG